MECSQLISVKVERYKLKDFKIVFSLITFQLGRFQNTGRETDTNNKVLKKLINKKTRIIQI